MLTMLVDYALAGLSTRASFLHGSCSLDRVTHRLSSSSSYI